MSITTLGHASVRQPCSMRYVYLSRVITNASKSEIVQHRNGEFLDCRRTNLRIVDRYGVDWRVEGELLRVTMKDGREIVMDADDSALLRDRRIKIDERGYVRLTARVPFECVRLSRTIMHTPFGMYCDHINGDKLDNRKINLRNCTSSENAHNRKGQQDCPNPYKGINYCKNRKGAKKWQAHIVVDGKRWGLGSFATAEEAAEAYNKKAIEKCGQFARINVIGTPKKTVSVVSTGV